jgi:hypothetical protein
MSKTRDTGFLANVIQVHDTGVRIMSGSEMLMAISSSGAVTITGELSGSDAANSLLLNGTGSVGFTTTGSFSTASGSASSRLTQIETVYATTGSNSFRATQSITGSLTVTGQIIAQTLNVQQVTSSIIFSTGSNTFGCDLNNRQTFTGSFYQTGSVANFSNTVCALNLVSTCNIRVGVNGGYAVVSGPTTGAAISLGSNSSTFDRNLSLGLIAGDLSFSPVLTINAQTSNVGIGNCTPDRRLYIADTSVTQGTFLAYNQCTTFCGTVIEAITDRTSNCTFNLMNLKASTTSMFLVRGDGKVGIGTASPAELLEIAGSLKIGNLKIENVNGGSIGFNRNTSNGAIYNCCYAAFQINGALSGTNYLDFQNYSSSGSYLGSFVFKDGCMGIGTTNPTGTYGKLTVAGGISILDNNTAKLEIGRYSSGAPNSYIKIGTNSNSLRITNAADSVDLLTIENSGITTFACNICVAKYLTVGSQGGGDIVFLGGGSGVGAAIEARYADGNPNVRLAGNGNSWINRSYGSVGIGTCTPNYLLDVNGAINSIAGTMYSNSVVTYAVGGTMAGTTAAYYDFPTWNDGGQGQMFEVKAFFDHFYNWNYGAHYYVYLTTRETNSQALTMFNCTTGNGGSWMAYKPNTTTLRVCKIAGTYVGGGAYWIQVTAKQP